MPLKSSQSAHLLCNSWRPEYSAPATCSVHAHTIYASSDSWRQQGSGAALSRAYKRKHILIPEEVLSCQVFPSVLRINLLVLSQCREMGYMPLNRHHTAWLPFASPKLECSSSSSEHSSPGRLLLQELAGRIMPLEEATRVVRSEPAWQWQYSYCSLCSNQCWFFECGICQGSVRMADVSLLQEQTTQPCGADKNNHSQTGAERCRSLGILRRTV